MLRNVDFLTALHEAEMFLLHAATHRMPEVLPTLLVPSLLGVEEVGALPCIAHAPQSQSARSVGAVRAAAFFAQRLGAGLAAAAGVPRDAPLAAPHRWACPGVAEPAQVELSQPHFAQHRRPG